MPSSSGTYQQLTSACLALLLLVSRTSSSETPCRCTPDQWEGILATDEREFDLAGGRTATSESSMYVSYDYKNRKYAMIDLNTKTKAIADYGKGMKYVVRSSGCRGIQTGEQMKQMCMPDEAMFIGAFSIGGITSADLWQFTGHNNSTMKSIVVHESCIPLQEEVHLQQQSYVSIQSSLYLDVTLGISDESVFQVPDDCMISRLPREMKREATRPSWTFADQLRDFQ